MTTPTSVLLPTVSPSPVVEQVAAQLGAEDELLVVCDTEADPIAGTDLPEGARLVVAGEPEGCSGKANAIDAGMAAAEHDRMVWTDDDFEHPPDWLDRLRADYEERGPVTEVPFFRGRDPLSVLLEPSYLLGGTVGVYLTDDIAWGGALIFDRSDLDVDAFRRDLRRTVSDDGILSEHCQFEAVKRVREVPVGGSVRDTLERHVRFIALSARHATAGRPAMIGTTILGLLLAVLFPLPMLVGWTAAVAGLYAFFGIRRWTGLLAYPMLFYQAPLLAYAFARRTFVWGGRRYRWRSMFDVEIVDD